MLSRLLPGIFLPLYDMISFSTIPYADAVARARRQWRVAGLVVGGLGIVLVVGLGLVLLAQLVSTDPG
jgi:kynurenine 3-monooxygenase